MTHNDISSETNSDSNVAYNGKVVDNFVNLKAKWVAYNGKVVDNFINLVKKLIQHCIVSPKTGDRWVEVELTFHGT